MFGLGPLELMIVGAICIIPLAGLSVIGIVLALRPKPSSQASTCPKCGQAASDADRFCRQCGQAL